MAFISFSMSIWVFGSGITEHGSPQKKHCSFQTNLGVSDRRVLFSGGEDKMLLSKLLLRFMYRWIWVSEVYVDTQFRWHAKSRFSHKVSVSISTWRLSLRILLFSAMLVRRSFDILFSSPLPLHLTWVLLWKMHNVPDTWS